MVTSENPSVSGELGPGRRLAEGEDSERVGRVGRGGPEEPEEGAAGGEGPVGI